MRSIIRLALAVFAVLAFGAVLAGTASAAEELFLTQSHLELLFLALSEKGTLRALDAGQLGTITCEHDLVHGWALNKSPLAHRVLVQFHGKCEQTVNGTTTKCTEPIETKLLLAELGLLLLPSGQHDVVILLTPSSGSEFVTVKCEGTLPTTVEGAVIGEFPEVNKKGENQYNKQLTEYELVFESENKNSENQKYTKLDLLKMEHPGLLKVSGFFGGSASEETTDILHSPTGWIEINIHA